MLGFCTERKAIGGDAKKQKCCVDKSCGKSERDIVYGEVGGRQNFKCTQCGRKCVVRYWLPSIV